MKKITLALCLLYIQASSQFSGKIIPIDKSILKLDEDTTKIILNHKLPSGYVVTINEKTNKKDTSLSYNEIIRVFDDKKRKKRS